MKLIEQGMHVTSPYFGDGYVLRSLKDTSTGKRYVVIRTLSNRDIIFCTFPQSVNRLFYLPNEFNQAPACSYLSLNWPDDFSDSYNANHTYIAVSLLWPECDDFRDLNFTSPQDAAPSFSYVHSASDVFDSFSHKYESVAKELQSELKDKKEGVAFAHHRIDGSALVDFNIEDL